MGQLSHCHILVKLMVWHFYKLLLWQDFCPKRMGPLSQRWNFCPKDGTFVRRNVMPLMLLFWDSGTAVPAPFSRYGFDWCRTDWCRLHWCRLIDADSFDARLDWCPRISFDARLDWCQARLMPRKLFWCPASSFDVGLFWCQSLLMPVTIDAGLNHKPEFY